MKKELTVVVTTHNRHHLLETRFLPHFLDMDVALMVVDSTAEPNRMAADNPKIDYIHCPNEPLPHKLVRPVLDRVKTPYMLMHADDTLTSEKALRRCVDFLDANPDYSSARGFVLQCHCDNKEAISTQNPETKLIDIDADRPAERVYQRFSYFDSLYYSVQRTDCWQEILRRLPQEMVNYYLADTYVAMMTVLHGKSKTLPMFYQATEGGPSINEDDLRYMCSPFKLATDSRYEGEVAATQRAARDYLMELSNVSETLADIAVNGGLAMYWLQDKKVKSFKDRLDNEWKSFLEKTFHKEKVKRRRAEKNAENRRRTEENVRKAFAMLDEEDMREYETLMKKVQTTFM